MAENRRRTVLIRATSDSDQVAFRYEPSGATRRSRFNGSSPRPAAFPPGRSTIANHRILGTVHGMQPLGSDDVVTGILARLGITAVDTQDRATTAINDELAARGLVGRVTGIRWGRLVIEADPVNAAALLWHREHLERLVTRVSDGTVTGIRLRTVHEGDTSE